MLPEKNEFVTEVCRKNACDEIIRDPIKNFFNNFHANVKKEKYTAKAPLFFIIPRHYKKELRYTRNCTLPYKRPDGNIRDNFRVPENVVLPSNYCYNPITDFTTRIRSLTSFCHKTSCIFIEDNLYVFNGFNQPIKKDYVCKYNFENDKWESNIFKKYTDFRTESVTLNHPFDSSKAIQIGGFNKIGKCYLSFNVYDFCDYTFRSHTPLPYEDLYQIEAGISHRNALFLFPRIPQYQCIVWDPRDNGEFSQKVNVSFMNGRRDYGITKNLESIFISGGDCRKTFKDNELALPDDILEFDTRMMKFRFCGRMLENRRMHCTFAYRNEIYFLGGTSRERKADHSIPIYNLRSNSWRKSKDILPRVLDVNCFAFNDKYFE
uniref:Kelch domain-containing protein n=1 Tax=Parastrongyloides trichosuri TaxID=131310 RepID=A0A0N4YZZ9_PARTI